MEVLRGCRADRRRPEPPGGVVHDEQARAPGRQRPLRGADLLLEKRRRRSVVALDQTEGLRLFGGLRPESAEDHHRRTRLCRALAVYRLWATMDEAPGKAFRLRSTPVAVDERHPQTMYAQVGEYGIRLCQRGGSSWKRCAQLPKGRRQVWLGPRLAVTQGVLFAGGQQGLVVSENGCRSWRRAGLDQEIRALGMSRQPQADSGGRDTGGTLQALVDPALSGVARGRHVPTSSAPQQSQLTVTRLATDLEQRDYQL